MGSIGPYDLSASIGLPGNFKNNKFKAALRNSRKV